MSLGKDIIDGVSNMVKDRIGHPFLGSFIFTFLSINYDILIDLANNIEDPLAVLFFKEVLNKEWCYRVGLPLLVMLTFPLFVQNIGNFVFAFFKNYTNRKIEDIKEGQENKIHKINAKNYQLKYENTIHSVNHTTDKSMQIISFILDELAKGLPQQEYYSIFRGEEKLNVGQYVSFVEIQNKIIPFTVGEMFLGVVTH